MCRTRRNPSRMSSFICLKCGKINGIKVPRTRQREKFHIKDLTCNTCGGEITKHIEIRSCDWTEEIKTKIPELHEKYYGSVETF